MKKTIGMLTFLGVFALMAVVAFAQPGPGGPGGGRGRGAGPVGPGGGMGPGMLLRNDEIKSRLELTDDQMTKLQKLDDEVREQFRNRGPAQRRQRGDQGTPPSPPSREEMEKMRKEMEDRQKEVQGKINQILTPAQQEKYKVIQFQASGGLDSPFLNANSLGVVGLSDEQASKIKAIEEKRMAEFREAMEKRGPIDWRGMSQEDRQKMGEEMRAQGEAMTKKYGEQIKAVLTPEQKEKAEKLTEEGKDLRIQRGPRPGAGPGGPEGEYRPGADSWQPGQGTPRKDGGNRQQRRAFPKAEE